MNRLKQAKVYAKDSVVTTRTQLAQIGLAPEPAAEAALSDTADENRENRSLQNGASNTHVHGYCVFQHLLRRSHTE